ncbi:MAG: addiction module toxin, HicA family [Actinobacteria bacterium]|nr:addiction module toxin, HicA family [Actinomycetota bacterium]
MPELPVVKPRKVINAFEKAGFIKIRTRGSHVQMKKGNLLVTIPFHNRDLNKGTLASILRQAQMTVDEFRDLI